MFCIDNRCTDIYFNLAAEEYLLKQKRGNFFMLWQSEPSVVMGKNQSVRAEVNEDYRIEKGIRLARRFSGGGAVYHDKGNINLTFIETTSQPLFEDYLQRIVGFLETMGVTAYTDERLGIYLDGKKISGSAQSIHKGRILHHATLLFSTDLYRLTTALKSTERRPERKEMKPAPFYVKSVRSPVTNICTYTRKAVSIGEFRDALLNYFTENKTDTRPYSFTEDDLNAIRSLRDNKYATSAWNFNIRT